MWKDSETKIDYLDFDYLKKTVIELVKREDLTPSSIGIYGNWGSGKSSLMKMCIDELSLMPDTLCIYFNGWLFESFEDTKTAIISKILDEIEANRSFKGKTKATLRRLYNNVDKMKVAQKSIQYGLDFMLTGGLGSLVDITFQSVLGSMKNKLDDAELKELSKLYKNNNKSKDIRKSIVSFQTDFATLLEDTKIKKLVVFIDELDRCNPDSILNTLEAIRLFLFVQNTSFVIGADENHIMNAVKMKFNQIKENQLAIGKEYLEKLVQYPIRIPQLSPKEINLYILCLLLSRDLEEHDFKLFLAFIDTERNKDCVNFEITTALIDQNLKDINVTVKNALSFSKQLSSVLANGLNGNPRHCKRFLNSLFMRIFMAKYRNISLEQRVLAKIMLLEYFRPSMFRKLAEIQAEERGKPEELKMIEKGEIDKLKQMSDWNQDKWIKDWVALEPRLTDIDLRP
ncbi:MAG TPA: P-loop NTPase fold protein, partial [Candidatus Cloacimonadota bacterium]|nr:P-loop NTPase fold protein [Candidatus Cloacimonadota bacterium]